jgi:hypothetical protein
MSVKSCECITVLLESFAGQRIGRKVLFAVPAGSHLREYHVKNVRRKKTRPPPIASTERTTDHANDHATDHTADHCA